ncbi:S-layer homology domain-containing protein [Paenibacillus frigoriresistens]|uniref:S-layer homology domain-containing protein n=1 Tax=Paenibacillus alginolyticus TaxID=59839 RepID=UPI00156381E4|nr:S-layer homology domain-containing protein [Paenibacillus frigoriresistens]NRF93633.1 S-layer homology domain-containing protein [Paenibacillus frigoriresistens]
MSKSSSNIVTRRLKNKPKDFQGGEIKVMKKSLSVILSTAMALSMFSSVAFGKTSADFTDLKDLDAATKAKFDALISAGIFDGVSETTFGLKDEMNRAQFAKVAALITGIEVNKDLKTSSFSDVKVDDAANGYALPFIEALKANGITDGYGEGTYNPAGKVTKEQLATFLVRVLGKDAEAKAKTGTDTTVSGWAQGYVALALELKLLPAGADGKFGGQANATRDLLLTGAYEAKQQYVPAGKVSVTGAKATGAQQVTVTFNKPVDIDKAKVALKNGTVDVATTTKFADDKKSAVLTLTDTKIRVGEYTVNVTGLDAATVDKTSATFTGQDEVVQKIDFVTASDTIAYATNVVVKIKATNQYGENASSAAGNYNTYGATKLTKDADGYLLATVNTTGVLQGSGIVTLTIINNDSHVTATKNYKVGTAPILSKMELGSAQYSSGDAITGSGDNVKFSMNLFDQYGSMMGYDSLLVGTPNELKTTVIWNDYVDGATSTVEDDGNNVPLLKLSLSKNVDKSGDYNFTVVNQAATTTGKITIKSANVATKIQIGTLDDVIAAGDDHVYVPVIAYDAQGNQLSLDDLVDNAKDGRFTVSSSASSKKTIEISGAHKGMIDLDQIPTTKNGAVSVSVFIATANVSSNDTKTYTVQAARIPDHFKEMTAPAKQVTVGGFTPFVFAVIDQYGKKMDSLIAVDSNGNAVGGSSNYAITAQTATYNAAGTLLNIPYNTKLASPADVTSSVYATVTSDDDFVSGANSFGSSIFNDVNQAPTSLTDLRAQAWDNTYRFYAANVPNAEGSKVDLSLRIMKDGLEITKFTKSVTVAKSKDDLTYSFNSVPALWNTIDSGAIPAAGFLYDDAAALTVAQSYLYDPTSSRFAREVTVSGKNKAGEAVGVAKKINAITSSDPTVAKVAVNGSGKAYVLGNKAGTAQISITFTTANGETKTLSTPITVKADALNVANITWDDNAYTDNLTFNAFTNLNVTDSYGRVYEDAGLGGRAQKYNALLGVTFSVTNPLNGTVQVDQYGHVSVTNQTDPTKPATFDLTATAPTGKSATVSITAKAGNGARTVIK